MEVDSPVPLLVSRVISEKIAADPAYAEAFVVAQSAAARRYYRRTGDPRISLLMGESVTAYCSTIPITGSAALGVLYLFLAELALAIGTRGHDLGHVDDHLAHARSQFEAVRNSTIQAKGLINWYWLSSINAKAHGRLGEYGSLLREPMTDDWIKRNAEPVDYAPVVRQRVMMSQDVAQHLVLLEQARVYQKARPLDYYRTVKRVTEFFTNQGMISSATMLENELVSAFSVVAKRSTLISRISFLKNVAHLRALLGDTSTAGTIMEVALRDATGAGLHGQVRQLDKLKLAMSEADMRGALITFRI